MGCLKLTHFTDIELKLVHRIQALTLENTAKSACNDLELIHTPEGYMEPQGKDAFRYVYRLQDHLGNTRVSFTKNQTTEEIDILQTLDFYPFGLEVERPNAVANSSNIGEAFKYNGKELQTEEGLDWYDYGWRNYNPSIGRWMNMDALSEEYLEHTPYNYTMSNPVRFTDVAGLYSTDEWMKDNGITQDDLVEVDWVEKADGSIVWDNDATSQETTKEGEAYLGKAVVVFNGSKNENLGTDGTLQGEGANPANVTVYGPGGEGDVKTYDGLSITSDPDKFSMIEAGDYQARWEQMASSPFRIGSLTYRIYNLDGSNRIKPVGGVNKANGKNYMSGIFLHRTNWNGFAGTRMKNGTTSFVSKGCPVICGTQWKQFENQIGKLSSFRLRINRE